MAVPSEVVADERVAHGSDSASAGLWTALDRLDGLLARAIEAARASFGAGVDGDAYRGLYVSDVETQRLLDRAPGHPSFDVSGVDATPLHGMGSLVGLGRRFGLSSFELDVLVVALAPELDLRYERLYAYLQDDVTRRRPTVDLALTLLSNTREGRLTRRRHFGAKAPLLRHRLLSLVPDSNQLQPPLLGHYLKIDEPVVRWLLGEPVLDPHLSEHCTLVEPAHTLADLPVSAETRRLLATLAAPPHQDRAVPWPYLRGPRAAGKRRIAEAFAQARGQRLLVVDASRGLPSIESFDQALSRLVREAILHDAVLYLHALRDDAPVTARQVLERLTDHRVTAILAGEQAPPAGSSGRPIVEVRVDRFDAEHRRQIWRSELALGSDTRADGAPDETAPQMTDADLEILADRYHLRPGQIAAAVVAARGSAARRVASANGHAGLAEHDPRPTFDELSAAARSQTGDQLAALTQKIEPLYQWDDLVLEPDTLDQLRELSGWVVQRGRVLDGWGFAGKLSQGRGINALFAGPSGTGKTMAAEVIARQLRLDLYRIDLARLVSKYIGETEKNLDQVFTAAHDANAILFFDEADALFGKRSEVRDSHDRYANLEISYLLQKMEQHDGLAILATNLRGNLDESFSRRLAFAIHFPFPDETARLRIWSGVWPSDTPLDDGIDFEMLARRFPLSGGNIKNVALAAAYLAADEGGRIGLLHVIHALRREYQKMGKVLDLTDFESERAGVAS